MTMVILCLMAVVITTISAIQFFLVAHNRNNLIDYVFFGCMVLTLLVIFAIATETRSQKEFDEYKAKYETVSVVNKIEMDIPDYYYQEAELIKATQIDNGTWNIEFCAYGQAGPIFIWNCDNAIDEDGVFLLTMKSNGTMNLLDDKIVVVWKSVN